MITTIKKLTNLDSIKLIRDPTSHKELANEKIIDGELDKNTFLRLNQTLENYLKVSVGNDTSNLSKYDEIPFTDTTFIRNSKTGGYVLPLWKTYCNDRNGGGKIPNFIRATKSSSSTIHSGATSYLLLVVVLCS